jgi:hypothetical protein
MENFFQELHNNLSRMDLSGKACPWNHLFAEIAIR